MPIKTLHLAITAEFRNLIFFRLDASFVCVCVLIACICFTAVEKILKLQHFKCWDHVQLQYLFNTPLITTDIPSIEMYKIYFGNSQNIELLAMVFVINPFKRMFIFVMVQFLSRKTHYKG
jgi:hypothetical protein